MKLSIRAFWALLLCSITASSTTLLMVYTPADGVILGIDSAISGADATEIQGGRISESTLACKIDRCGRYFVAGVGLASGPKDEKITDICGGIAGSTRTIDEFSKAIEPIMINWSAYLIADMIASRKPPAENLNIMSLAIAGVENRRPALRYFNIRFGGLLPNGKTSLNIDERIACPGINCPSPVQRIAGESGAVAAASNGGYYPKSNGQLDLVEKLLQLEITANLKTRRVRAPTSIVQIKNATPYWYKTGLCKP